MCFLYNGGQVTWTELLQEPLFPLILTELFPRQGMKFQGTHSALWNVFEGSDYKMVSSKDEWETAVQSQLSPFSGRKAPDVHCQSHNFCLIIPAGCKESERGFPQKCDERCM